MEYVTDSPLKMSPEDEGGEVTASETDYSSIRGKVSE